WPPPTRVRGPDDRGGQREVRPVRTAGGVVRRRLRDQPARAPDRREAREGSLVPLASVRRPDRAGVGVSEPRGAARGARNRDRVVVPRDVADEPALPPAAEGGFERG